MRLATPIAALVAALALAACGRDPLDPPDPSAQTVRLTRTTSFPTVGMKVKTPRRVQKTDLERPAVFRIQLGAGFISCFLYRRTEPLPKGRAELTAARERLLVQVREGRKRFEVKSSRLFKVADADAIEIRGRQAIAREPLETRSVHVFKGKGEYVLELLVPPRAFAKANRQVFDPMLRSLRLTGKPKQSAAERAAESIQKASEAKQQR